MLFRVRIFVSFLRVDLKTAYLHMRSDALARLIVVNILWYIQISIYYFAHLKLMLYVNYISIFKNCDFH